jgi:hypothetical protein
LFLTLQKQQFDDALRRLESMEHERNVSVAALEGLRQRTATLEFKRDTLESEKALLQQTLSRETLRVSHVDVPLCCRTHAIMYVCQLQDELTKITSELATERQALRQERDARLQEARFAAEGVPRPAAPHRPDSPAASVSGLSDLLSKVTLFVRGLLRRSCQCALVVTQEPVSLAPFSTDSELTPAAVDANTLAGLEQTKALLRILQQRRDDRCSHAEGLG